MESSCLVDIVINTWATPYNKLRERIQQLKGWRNSTVRLRIKDYVAEVLHHLLGSIFFVSTLSYLCTRCELKLANLASKYYAVCTITILLTAHGHHLVQAGKTIPANLATITACTNVDYVYCGQCNILCRSETYTGVNRCFTLQSLI